MGKLVKPLKIVGALAHLEWDTKKRVQGIFAMVF